MSGPVLDASLELVYPSRYILSACGLFLVGWQKQVDTGGWLQTTVLSVLYGSGLKGSSAVVQYFSITLVQECSSVVVQCNI